MGLEVKNPSWEATDEDKSATKKELARFTLINPTNVWLALRTVVNYKKNI
jgi:hypothetical protein